MAVRTLDQVVSSLRGVYDPQVKSVQQQKALIPQGVEADIKQAEAAQTQSFDDIMASARRRGIGYSGLPIGEQQKYSSTVFAPEVLRARQRGRQQELSLQDALNSIYERRNNQALALQQQDIANNQWNQTFGFEKQKWAETLRQQALDRAEAARARAAASGYGGGYLGGGSTTANAGSGMVGTMTQKKTGITGQGGGGYAFTDAQGRPISAAMFAKNNGMTIPDILRKMGEGGDTYAARAYNWFNQAGKMDAFKDPNRLMQQAQTNFSPLFWGYR